MFRRLSSLALPAAIIVTTLGACGNGPTPSPTPLVRTDPKDILTAAFASAQKANSVHLEATLDGTLSLDLTGSGSSSPFTLTGTTAGADADLAKQATHASFAVPALLGLTGDAILVDGKAYLKTTLTGTQYSETDGVLSQVPVGSAAPADMLAQLADLLSKPGVDPTKGADIGCGPKQCYTVDIELTPLELASLGVISATSTLPVDLSDSTVALDFRVEQDTDRLAGLTATIVSPTQGTLKLDIVLSKWGEPVTIAAPPADQIKPAG